MTLFIKDSRKDIEGVEKSWSKDDEGSFTTRKKNIKKNSLQVYEPINVSEDEDNDSLPSVPLLIVKCRVL